MESLAMSAIVAETVGSVTAEEFWRLSQSEEFRGELIAGEVRELTPPGFEHSCIFGNVYEMLLAFVKARKLGKVLGECGFLISRDPDTVLAPDVAFISAERMPATITRKFCEVVPDLAVEVVSPGDAYSEVRDKAERYLAGGVKEVWIADPRRGVVEVVRPPDKWIVLRGDDLIETPLLPGFSAPARSVFV